MTPFLSVLKANTLRLKPIRKVWLLTFAGLTILRHAVPKHIYISCGKKV